MKNIFSKLNHYALYSFALFGVVLALFAANYIPGTTLSGWDNLHPEYNFATNVWRGLFTVWQQHFGLGAYSGMELITDLPRTFVLWLFSLVLPVSLLRYISMFGLMFIGAVGMYILLVKLFFKEAKQYPFAFLGALFYLLNLATIQMVYTPFEAFQTHFAALPWLLCSATLFLGKPTRKRFLFTVFVNLIFVGQAFIPTLFVTYLLALGVLSLGMFFTHLFKKEHALHILKRSITLLGIIFCTNAFWLLPFLFYTATHSGITLDAKINQMATDDIYLRNREFGDFANVALLKGFWFNNVEADANGNYLYMLAPWKDYLSNPLLVLTGLSFFLFTLVGLVRAVRKRSAVGIAMAGVFLLGFTMLATTTFPFSLFSTIFRDVPLFGQAFRFPFTKFSLLLGFAYSIFFAYGVEGVVSLLKKHSVSVFGAIILSLLVVIYSFPAFQGHLFYEKEHTKLPTEYEEMFSFFQNQDPTTRIANFPQSNFWGWTFYRFSQNEQPYQLYSGSGFLWYAIPQPIMDTVIDVWSNTSENYYYELTHALYSKNPTEFENVLEKYDISWLVVDKNVIYPASSKALFTTDLETIVATIPSISKQETFGNITVYKVSLKTHHQSFLSLLPQLPVVNTYQWANIDQSYQSVGNYISSNTNPTFVYPFRSLFTLKKEEEKTFAMEESENSIRLSTKLPSLKNNMITIPSLIEKEEFIPATVTTQTDSDNNQIVSLVIQTPTIYINNSKVFGESENYPLFKIDPQASYPYTITINGVASFKVTKDNNISQTASLTTHQDTFIDFTDSQGKTQRKIVPTTLLTNSSFLQEQTISFAVSNPETMTIDIPKVTDSYNNTVLEPTTVQFSHANCDRFRNGTVSMNQGSEIDLKATNATLCLSFNDLNLSHNIGYAYFVQNANIIGKPLHVWILNYDEGISPLDTYVTPKTGMHTSSFIIPPYEQFGKGYSLHFDNESISAPSENILGTVSMYPIPYSFITNLSLGDTPSQPDSIGELTEAKNINPSEYSASTTPSDSPQTIVLSQSFDSGWSLFEFSHTPTIIDLIIPFITGKKNTNHVQVNNWENGWIIDTHKQTHVVILYMPQYLSYIGIGITIVSILIFMLVRRNK